MSSLIVEIRAAEGGADAKALVREQLEIYLRVAARRDGRDGNIPHEVTSPHRRAASVLLVRPATTGSVPLSIQRA